MIQYNGSILVIMTIKIMKRFPLEKRIKIIGLGFY